MRLMMLLLEEAFLVESLTVCILLGLLDLHIDKLIIQSLKCNEADVERYNQVSTGLT